MPSEHILSAQYNEQINLCPVCGGYVTFDEYFNKVHAVCMNCGLSGLLYKKTADVVMEWNRIGTIDTNAENP